METTVVKKEYGFSIMARVMRNGTNYFICSKDNKLLYIAYRDYDFALETFNKFVRNKWNKYYAERLYYYNPETKKAILIKHKNEFSEMVNYEKVAPTRTEEIYTMTKKEIMEGNWVRVDKVFIDNMLNKK